MNRLINPVLPAVLLLLLPASLQADKPNIVFIFVDDQGYYDLGCYGATEVKTPRIDAMARAGNAIYGLLRGGSDLQPVTRGLVDRVLSAPGRQRDLGASRRFAIGHSS